MQLHESDGARSVFGNGVALRRFELAGDVDVCICAYRATAGARWRAVSNRLELGVQLAGALEQRAGTRPRPRRYPARTIHVLSPGDTYDVAYAADARTALAVWLAIDVERICPDRDREVRGSGDGDLDPELEEVARMVCDDSRDRDSLAAEVRPALESYVRRRCHLRA